MSPKKSGNAFSDVLLMSRFKNFAGDTATALRAVFLKAALRAILIQH